MNKESTIMKYSRWLAYLLCQCLMLEYMTGCASFSGYPDRLIPQSEALEEIKPTLTRIQVESCMGSETITCRNKIIAAGMLGIDINFSEFEKKLFQENREASFLTTITTLGLTTAGAMTGTAVLSAISTGLIGAKSAFDSQVLLDRAILAIHTQMRAQRDVAAVRLRGGMQQDIASYPLALAITDIEAYYNAGTLLSAFVGITESAGVKANIASKNLENVITSRFTETRTSLILERWLFDPNGEVNSDHVKQMDTWLKKNNIGMHSSMFMNSDDPKMEIERQRAIQDPELKIPH
ncbi:hypothetical protein MGMO_93c00050 [Methyloglobulus morosus KoM1]|uniref:Uncharacterized protein n=1 Tax=Methyloglobulus morosus KoM1 TaxID=1116472 RepID=V5BZJ1_9GAMM|nr:hypothetical protein [Methyloglobulus morosus]ESS71647.1 hypothetical protein MGMO_93c00050 [Methyloglobulus morosus KoM1]